jgi:predicted GNAT family acetyltransferase
MEFILEDDRIFAEDARGQVLAEVTFPSRPNGIAVVNHTFVIENLRGRGIAGELMKAVAEKLRREHRRAVATCPYSVSWFESHSEYRDVYFVPNPAKEI